MNKHSGHTILSPRVTEKGAYLAAQGAYVFNVAVGASKKEVAQAIRDIYKVSPRKVTLAAVARKAVTTRGTNRQGQTTGGKKAYVFLKKDEKIDLA